MGIISDIFKNIGRKTTYIMGSGARSQAWNREINSQAVCRAIMDCNAVHTASAQALHVRMDGQGRIKEIFRTSPYTKLFQRPNPMMSGFDFLYAMSWQLDEKNTAIAWIEWAKDGTPANIWPIAWQQYEFRKIVEGGYAVAFTDMDGQAHTLFADDCVILRQHYSGAGMSGESNAPVYDIIRLNQTVQDTLAQAASTSNKIAGVVKAKNAMLSIADVKGDQLTFAERLKAAGEGGAGVLELQSGEDYQPLSFNNWSANAVQMRQVKDDLFTYWRTPLEVVANTASEQVMQNFFESRIEPRWLAMGQAFTTALFTTGMQDHGNRMILTGGAASGASWSTKLNIINNTKELGLLTVNEYRQLIGYPPTADGDVQLVSLNYCKNTDLSKYQLDKLAGDDAPAEPPDTDPTVDDKQKEEDEDNAI